MVPGDREGLSVRSQLPVQAYGDSAVLATTAMSVLQHTRVQDGDKGYMALKEVQFEI